MEVAMETGTLKELNVKPGDVVEPASNSDGSEKFEVMEDCKLKAMYAGGGGHVLNRGWYWDECIFRIISRAAQPTDLTAITTPFGLLDAATQEALRAHGGPYEMYAGSSTGHRWQRGCLGEYKAIAYRVKPGPVIETEIMKITNADGIELAQATVTTRNGNPDWSTLQVRHD